jgi:putative FmdB family regulatory protein
VPIYEYVCEACGRLTEVIQKVSDRPPATCPECGGDKLAKVMSRTSFQLKGGGWYSDLYASAGKGKAKPEAAPAGSAAKPAAPAAPSGGGTAGGATAGGGDKK